MNGRETDDNTINFRAESVQRSHGPVVRGGTFFAGGSWDAGSNPGVVTSSFFFLSLFFYTLAFYCLFSLMTLLASRDFCENVFLVSCFYAMKLWCISFLETNFLSKNHSKCNFEQNLDFDAFSYTLGTAR